MNGTDDALRYHPEIDPPTADDILAELGSKFVHEYNESNRKTAWQNFMLGLMEKIDVLQKSRYVQNLRDLVTIAREIDKEVGSGGKQDVGAAGQPFDKIADKWTVRKQGAEGGGTDGEDGAT